MQSIRDEPTILLNKEHCVFLKDSDDLRPEMLLPGKTGKAYRHTVFDVLAPIYFYTEAIAYFYLYIQNMHNELCMEVCRFAHISVKETDHGNCFLSSQEFVDQTSADSYDITNAGIDMVVALLSKGEHLLRVLDKARGHIIHLNACLDALEKYVEEPVGSAKSKPKKQSRKKN